MVFDEELRQAAIIGLTKMLAELQATQRNGHKKPATFGRRKPSVAGPVKAAVKKRKPLSAARRAALIENLKKARAARAKKAKKSR